MTSASRVLLLHGFTQSAGSWPPVIVDRLRRDGHDVEALDAPGHGEQSHVRTDLAGAAATVAHHARPRASLVGYSMGGRVALHVAVHSPDVVDRVVLIGATAGIEDPAERAARRAADEELAASIERDGVDAFLERWLQNPLFATLPSDAAALDSRRGNTVAGLAASLRSMGTGTQEPLWASLPHVHHPALFLVGALDEKFAAIAERMAAAWGGPAELSIVPNAGHAVHLERPDEVAARIATFLGGRHAATSAAASTTP